MQGSIHVITTILFQLQQGVNYRIDTNLFFHEKLLIGKVYLYTQVQRQRNERDPNKNSKGKIMEEKILMRGKNAQYISEEIGMSCF